MDFTTDCWFNHVRVPFFKKLLIVGIRLILKPQPFILEILPYNISHHKLTYLFSILLLIAYFQCFVPKRCICLAVNETISSQGPLTRLYWPI